MFVGRYVDLRLSSNIVTRCCNSDIVHSVNSLGPTTFSNPGAGKLISFSLFLVAASADYASAREKVTGNRSDTND